MTKVARKYLIYTFIFTFLSWGIIDIGNIFGVLIYETPISMVLFFIGGWVPTVVAYILLHKYGENKGIKTLFKESFKLKHPIGWYIVVFVVIAIYYGIHILMGCSTQVGPLYMFILSLPITILFGGLEEHGWRFLMQTELEKKLSIWPAAAITGVAWSLWHLPLYFIKGYESIENFPVFFIDTFGFAFILAAIWKESKSIWLCILCHALLNAGSRVFDVNESLADSIVQTIVFMLLTFLLINRKKIFAIFNKKTK